MSSDVMKTCANLILTGAIEDFALENNIPLSEARRSTASDFIIKSL